MVVGVIQITQLHFRLYALNSPSISIAVITSTLDNQRIKNLFARVNTRILPCFCSIINYLITALPLLGAKSSTWMNSRRSLHRDNPDTAWNSSFIVSSIISYTVRSQAVRSRVEARRKKTEDLVDEERETTGKRLGRKVATRNSILIGSGLARSSKWVEINETRGRFVRSRYQSVSRVILGQTFAPKHL